MFMINRDFKKYDYLRCLVSLGLQIAFQNF